jgi:hypothetical protein
MLTDHVIQVVVQKMPEIVQAHNSFTWIHWLKDNSIALVGCGATAIAAYANVRSASLAKQTVIQANKERSEDRERARPRISIKEIKCNQGAYEILPQSVTEKPSFDYFITLINETRSKLTALNYAIIPTYNGKKGILNPSNLEPLPIFGDDTLEITIQTTIDETGIAPNELGYVLCFFRAIDVFGNQRDCIKMITHGVTEEDANNNGLVWRKFTVGRWIGGGSFDIDLNGYTIEDITPQFTRILINESRKFSPALQAFILSFEEIKAEFKWFKNWKDIGKR